MTRQWVLLLIAVFCSVRADAFLANSAFWKQNWLLPFVGQVGGPGYLDGAALTAQFNQPSGTAVDTSGNVFVADHSNSLIRKITSAGVVSTFAGGGGDGTYSLVDGTGTAACFASPYGITIDASNNLYVADTQNNAIRMITPAGVVTTIAGSGAVGSANGTGTGATFNQPFAITLTGTTLYVADTGNNMIRKVTTAGVVTTLAGSTTAGSANGTGTAASFNAPYGIGVDTSGNVYVGDSYNHMIRKITSAGAVTTFAGSTTSGSGNGTGTAATFNFPVGIVVDSSGNIYVGDQNNDLIRKITSAKVVTTFAGSSIAGSINATGTAATLNAPAGVSLDASNNLYVADLGNNLIRKITSAGVVTTYAGAGVWGQVNGTGTAASFTSLAQAATDSSGNLYVADSGSQMIRKITPAGVVTTLAGGSYGFTNGTGTAASFSTPTGIAVDSSGTVYVADQNNHAIRKISSAGVVTTLAGSGSPGATNGTGTAATFNLPKGVAVDSSGNVYVGDAGNNLIRKITSAGVVTTYSGSGSQGSANGSKTAASFYTPTGLVLDSSGNLFVADADNNLIRKVTSTGAVTTFAGTVAGGAADGTGTAAQFVYPMALAIDSTNNIFVADTFNWAVRKITPGGVVTTLAGKNQFVNILGTHLPGSLSYTTSVAVFGNKVYVGLTNAIAYFSKN